MAVPSRWKIVFWIAGGALALFVAASIIGAIEISRHAREWVVAGLEEQFKSTVELGNFSFSVYPDFRAGGDNLVLHFQGAKDLPPLISIKHFSVSGPLLSIYRRHIHYIYLDGLEINVPPRGEPLRSPPLSARRAFGNVLKVYLDQIVAEKAVIRTLTRKPGKDPLEFDIDRLVLHSAGSSGALAFQATLMNPKPRGVIVSNGTFGPWNADIPSLTPVSGSYTFDKADLGSLPGIKGTLNSKGSYEGQLEVIQADGTADVPNFQLDRGGHQINLATKFTATVDGTNGDTYLHPVEAHLGKNSTLLANGSIEGHAGTKGKTISLDVIVDRGRIEDLMMLAVKNSAPMTGAIRLKTKLFLPPGTSELPDRIALNGSFALDAVRFTNSTTQQKLDNLSKRSQGKAKQIVDPTQAVKDDDVASAMAGNFRLGGGILTLSNFGYSMPGADIRLDGIVNLGPQTLDLHGKLEMQAKLSQTQTGPKSLLLKVVDPFFSKDGKGTVLPIKIVGPLQHPAFGLDRHRKQESANK